jgi:hypothetical protein
VTPLAELFPDGDYRFHLTLRRGEPGEFFGSRDATGRLCAERARWLAENPARYAALLPEGEPLLAELAEMGERDWQLPRAASVSELGAVLEPDFLLLSPDAEGVFRLRGGALCFPTGWALEEKLGHTLDFIHGVVPGLNAALTSPIQQFLSRLKPGVASQRDNWGLVATEELNLHPSRRLPGPALPVALDRLWLRVEHQALVALPRTGGVLFGIRIALHRLDDVARDAAASAGLRRALASMSAEVVAYKRLDAVRGEIIRRL